MVKNIMFKKALPHSIIFSLFVTLLLFSLGAFAFQPNHQVAHAASASSTGLSRATQPLYLAEMAMNSRTAADLALSPSLTTTSEFLEKVVPLDFYALLQGTIPANDLFLPFISHSVTSEQEMALADRIGFGLTSSSLAAYTDVTTLTAGWYLDWRVREQPERPNDMQYVQMIRVHQELACGEWYHADRNLCPYSQPLNYRFRPSQSVIEAAAIANPGSLWLIGNEMDRIDWAYCKEWNGSHCDVVGYNGQDEILPETYAVAYHDLYTMLKAVDPTAQIAIGGIIQPTPLRLQYLTAIWDHYQTLYTETMPVDVWNVHNFIIQEKKNNWGADIPPGVNGTEGEYVNNPQSHIDMEIFGEQIVAFREWMKARGQQNKPLVVSEYGVLYHNSLMSPLWSDSDPSYVQTFMTESFDYFANTKDCNLGYPADDCRLVQQWNWYSLDDTWGSFNPHSRLFNPDTGEITSTGVAFRTYIQAASESVD